TVDRVVAAIDWARTPANRATVRRFADRMNAVDVTAENITAFYAALPWAPEASQARAPPVPPPPVPPPLVLPQPGQGGQGYHGSQVYQPAPYQSYQACQMAPPTQVAGACYEGRGGGCYAGGGGGGGVRGMYGGGGGDHAGDFVAAAGALGVATRG